MAKSNKKPKFSINNIGKTLGDIKQNMDRDVSKKVLPSAELVQNLSKDFAFVPIEQIEVNPDQPRKNFDATDLNDLKNSINVHGLIQPITVRRMAEGQYQLISGERRWRASKLAELKEIPAFIRVANDTEMMEMALVENTHRADLNPIEVAITYHRLVNEFDLTHEKLAERVESSRTSVTNYMRLLKLPEEVQKALKDNKISMGHARALIGVDDYAGQVALLNSVLEEGLSVRALERIIKKSKEPKAPKESTRADLPADYQHAQDQLSRYLGSKTQLKRDAKSGKGSITINFSNDSDLNRLIELIEE
ncbi:MAG: ParB family chromosome partitioning protein [Granulosicoccus sp.]|jgi:ParB family chromosome partitioning protein